MSRILNQPAMPKCIRGWGGEESSILEGEERVLLEKGSLGAERSLERMINSDIKETTSVLNTTTTVL